MPIEVQTKDNTTYPYLWCHMCSKPKESGIFLSGGFLDKRKKMRVCFECVDKMVEMVKQSALGS